MQVILTGTFSIVAIDATAGEAGVAVASKYPAVGEVVPFVRAGVGAVATQCHHNPPWGPRALDMLAKGAHPAEVIAALLKEDEKPGLRQLAAIDMQGRVANHNPYAREGDGLWWGSLAGRFYSCQGNSLVGMQVIHEMAKAFETTSGTLADRLMASLVAGDRAGGDHRGRLGAAILVAGPKHPDKPLDLRVDKDDDAVNALHRKYLACCSTCPFPPRPD